MHLTERHGFEKNRPMAKKRSLLEKMRANPQNDWQIKDIETLCNQLGLACNPPSRGDHYKVFSALLDGVLTIPAHKPIKPFYIKQVIGLASAHIAATRSGQ